MVDREDLGAVLGFKSKDPKLMVPQGLNQSEIYDIRSDFKRGWLLGWIQGF